MNCQRCGYQIPDTAAFCPNCGAQKAGANATANGPQQAAQYPPNPYLQNPYTQQGNPPQGYSQPQAPFQQNPYPQHYQQPSYPAKPPAQQQSKAVRILIAIAAILSMIVGLLRIFRVFR
ncbi:MAG: zinc-ribbon domain-containing protein [Acidobacteriota bacterium]|nr:zinc-ribbon domain-containing protein [Acidobacteriota bacterium]